MPKFSRIFLILSKTESTDKF